MTYCSNCGKEINDEKFCPECGVEVATTTSQQTPKVAKCFTIFGNLGYTFGIISFILSFIPFINVIALELGPIGIVFSILGKKDVSLENKTRKGLIFSILGTVIGFILFLTYVIILEFSYVM